MRGRLRGRPLAPVAQNPGCCDARLAYSLCGERPCVPDSFTRSVLGGKYAIESIHPPTPVGFVAQPADSTTERARGGRDERSCGSLQYSSLMPRAARNEEVSRANAEIHRTEN